MSDNQENNVENVLPFEELMKTHFILSMDKLMSVEGLEIPPEWFAMAQMVSLEGQTSAEKSRLLLECIIAIADASFKELEKIYQVEIEQEQEEGVNE